MSWDATALDEADNVATALRALKPGEALTVNIGQARVELRAIEDVALCHKIAMADIAAGDAVVKYGECIGEAIRPIRRGEWVHIHNMRSRRARAAA